MGHANANKVYKVKAWEFSAMILMKGGKVYLCKHNHLLLFNESIYSENSIYCSLNNEFASKISSLLYYWLP